MVRGKPMPDALKESCDDTVVKERYVTTPLALGSTGKRKARDIEEGHPPRTSRGGDIVARERER